MEKLENYQYFVAEKSTSSGAMQMLMIKIFIKSVLTLITLSRIEADHILIFFKLFF